MRGANNTDTQRLFVRPEDLARESERARREADTKKKFPTLDERSKGISPVGDQAQVDERPAVWTAPDHQHRAKKKKKGKPSAKQGDGATVKASNDVRGHMPRPTRGRR